ncbi:potassium channel family protein [Alisedimentitalea sp. MJ-SS2]|uniref:potassium channel family protein n=1 Tax=Aliisedimentitalea sp. MJ-SS2 TaxID=3049795 RepID=UPI00290664D8|nr:potassium channel family protein [Alisedimentitalea sp. MJ-SS2]MDU8926888.1 potassium channel family protein [Alisedimentitalea sp. MJ-SS2]
MSTARIVVSLLVMVVAGGTVFFRFVEGWSWIDAYFFTVVTLSTVGYGNLVPATALGKVFTTVFIFVGLGIFAFAIQQFAEYAVKRRQERGKSRGDEENRS